MHRIKRDLAYIAEAWDEQRKLGDVEPPLPSTPPACWEVLAITNAHAYDDFVSGSPPRLTPRR